MKSIRDFLATYRRLILVYSSDDCRGAILKIFSNLVRSRIFEEKIIALARKGMIPKKWIFGGIGQEGGQAAIASVLGAKDWLIPSYRGYTCLIARGVPMRLIAAEVLGKKTGPLKGLGAPYTLHSKKYGLAKRGETLGPECAAAVGMALALRQRGIGGMVAVFFGDGAATRGPVWSAINISVLWKLPVLWVCENNQYAVTTPVSALTATPFFKKAAAFGAWSGRVDGNDALAVYFSARKALELIRREQGPAFLELVTYRRMGHDLFYMSDQSYQDQAEIQEWSRRDPLVVLGDQLHMVFILKQTEIDEIKHRAVDEAEEAIAWASTQEGMTKEEFLATSFL